MTSRQREHFALLLRAERLQLNETLRRVQSGKHDAVDDRKLLDNVNTALELLSDHPDRYGVCEICNGPIAATRLEVVPATRRCGRHAEGAPALRILT